MHQVLTRTLCVFGVFWECGAGIFKASPQALGGGNVFFAHLLAYHSAVWWRISRSQFRCPGSPSALLLYVWSSTGTVRPSRFEHRKCEQATLIVSMHLTCLYSREIQRALFGTCLLRVCDAQSMYNIIYIPDITRHSVCVYIYSHINWGAFHQFDIVWPWSVAALSDDLDLADLGRLGFRTVWGEALITCASASEWQHALQLQDGMGSGNVWDLNMLHFNVVHQTKKDCVIFRARDQTGAVCWAVVPG